MNHQTTARGRAIARQDEKIAQNVAQIEEAKTRPNAIQAMASRLNITPAKLQETLRNTVFRDANESEFAALIVVANEYRLNPLTKEIFAFKAKGGGIIPYVSVDGWIRIINEHPQFDGLEFDDIYDDGAFVAIECTIWRKDRSRPIKVVEYLDECARETEPWKKSPKRFLRHRALMQCGRVAFGFSGISNDDDYEVIPGGDLEPMRQAQRAPLPRRDEVLHGHSTGEIIDHQEGRAPSDMGERHNGTDDDEETARQLDEALDPRTGEITSGDDAGPDWTATVASIKAEMEARATAPDVNSYWSSIKALVEDMSEALRDEIENAKAARILAIRKAVA